MRKRVYLERKVVDRLLSYCRSVHPDEGILLLRGRVKKDRIIVSEVVIPPFALHAESFSSFLPHMLPIDFSIVGAAHAHPSGVVKPSLEDLNNFYGRIMVIVGYPYESEADIGVFDSEGSRALFSVI